MLLLFARVKLIWLLVVTTLDDDVGKFLWTHDECNLKDVAVEEMRRIIPKLFMYCENRDATSCRKGLVCVSYC